VDGGFVGIGTGSETGFTLGAPVADVRDRNIPHKIVREGYLNEHKICTYC